MRPRGLLDYRALQNFSQARWPQTRLQAETPGSGAPRARVRPTPVSQADTEAETPGCALGETWEPSCQAAAVGVRIYMYYANSRFTCFGHHCGDFGTVGYGDNASRAALRFVRISGGGGVRGRDPQSRRFWQRQSGPGARRTGRMESRAVRYLQLRRSGDDPLQEVRHGYPHVLLQKTGVTRPGRSSEPQPPSPAAGTEGPSPCTPVTWACSSGPGPGTSGLASGIGSRPAPATGG